MSYSRQSKIVPNLTLDKGSLVLRVYSQEFERATNLTALMKRALMAFLLLNSQFSREIKCLNKNSPYYISCQGWQVCSSFIFFSIFTLALCIQMTKCMNLCNSAELVSAGLSFTALVPPSSTISTHGSPTIRSGPGRMARVVNTEYPYVAVSLNVGSC